MYPEVVTFTVGIAFFVTLETSISGRVTHEVSFDQQPIYLTPISRSSEIITSISQKKTVNTGA